MLMLLLLIFCQVFAITPHFGTYVGYVQTGQAKPFNKHYKVPFYMTIGRVHNYTVVNTHIGNINMDHINMLDIIDSPLSIKHFSHIGSACFIGKPDIMAYNKHYAPINSKLIVNSCKLTKVRIKGKCILKLTGIFVLSIDVNKGYRNIEGNFQAYSQ